MSIKIVYEGDSSSGKEFQLKYEGIETLGASLKEGEELINSYLSDLINVKNEEGVQISKKAKLNND